MWLVVTVGCLAGKETYSRIRDYYKRKNNFNGLYVRKGKFVESIWYNFELDILSTTNSKYQIEVIKSTTNISTLVLRLKSGNFDKPQCTTCKFIRSRKSIFLGADVLRSIPMQKFLLELIRAICIVNSGVNVLCPQI